MLTEYVIAVVSVIGAVALARSLRIGTPEMAFGELPSMTESGVYLPLSIAAAAVRTLNVEPGA